MKKYIVWTVWFITVLSWVFAYNAFKSPEQLLHEYVVNKCGVQEYGYSERVNYTNYKEIWDNICGFVSLEIPEEDATLFADFLDEITSELKK